MTRARANRRPRAALLFDLPHARVNRHDRRVVVRERLRRVSLAIILGSGALPRFPQSSELARSRVALASDDHLGSVFQIVQARGPRRLLVATSEQKNEGEKDTVGAAHGPKNTARRP